MPIIEENKFFTPIIEFNVALEKQQAFIDAIGDEVERYFKNYDGFVSASFHASNGGTRVINYAQWLSKEQWAASTAGNAIKDGAAEAIQEIITRYDVASPPGNDIGFFRVARVIENTEGIKKDRQDKKEITAVIEQYRRGFAEMNPELLKHIWDKSYENIIYIAQEKSQPVRGWQAVEQYYENLPLFLTNVKSMTIDDLSINVFEAIAYVFCTYSFESEMKGQSQPHIATGRNTFILHRKENVWKVIHYHESAIGHLTEKI